jgi:hypothetical protein
MVGIHMPRCSILLLIVSHVPMFAVLREAKVNGSSVCYFISSLQFQRYYRRFIYDIK